MRAYTAAVALRFSRWCDPLAGAGLVRARFTAFHKDRNGTVCFDGDDQHTVCQYVTTKLGTLRTVTWWDESLNVPCVQVDFLTDAESNPQVIYCGVFNPDIIGIYCHEFVGTNLEFQEFADERHHLTGRYFRADKITTSGPIVH